MPLVFSALKVANMCCKKEEALVKSTLALLGSDVAKVEVNMIQRTAYVRHRTTVSAETLVSILNEKNLGASIALPNGQATLVNADDDGSQASLCCFLWSDWQLYACLFVPITLLVLSLCQLYEPKVNLALKIAAVVLSSKDLLLKAYQSVKVLSLNMSILMALVLILAIFLGHLTEAAEISILYALSELISRVTLDHVSAIIKSLRGDDVPLVARLPPDAREVPLSSVDKGDTVMVRTGDVCNVDGTVVQGQASMDESPLTGESLPVVKDVGEDVYVGTLCVSGSVLVEVARLSSDEEEEIKIEAAMSAALSSNSKIKLLSQRFAQIFTPVVLVLAAIQFLYLAEKMHEPVPDALRTALSAVLISCPCAVVMASPLLEAVALAVCKRRGLVLRRSSALEGLAGAGIVAFDKTGTLTHGRFSVVDDIVVERSPLKRAFKKAGFPRAANVTVSALQLAASLEATSSHPLAAAVVNHYTGCAAGHLAQALVDPHVGLFPVKDGSLEPLAHGRGLRGTVLVPIAGQSRSMTEGIEARVDVGNKDVLENCLDPDIESFQEKHEAMAHTTIFVKVNRNEALGMALQDTLRPLAKTAIHQIVNMGIQVAILSGDLPSTVRSVADELRIGYRNAHGGFTATNKEHWVWRATKGGTKACASSIADLEEGGDAAACFGESPSSKGKAVVFVGDGMNDTKALRAAEVGIAMGSGTGLAVDAADAVLVKDDLSVIPWAILYSRRCRWLLFLNIGMALVLKMIVAVLALQGLLSLSVAVFSDVGGLCLVIANSLRALNDQISIPMEAQNKTYHYDGESDSEKWDTSARVSEGMALLGDTHAKTVHYGSGRIDPELL
uniref:P-type ATPase A domain-containing protein n=1 Tax=Pinguiococcus pyrenoidosus TaxID=172671 RepID=A0A6U0UBW4_9STRA|mmetsp:Transcript_13933/g.51979  ORF Transcript_13933/g.51979 Transcript_13933/m.51979 type:complete len:843 (+) Transcript_13933:201-2729(+)